MLQNLPPLCFLNSYLLTYLRGLDIAELKEEDMPIV